MIRPGTRSNRPRFAMLSAATFALAAVVFWPSLADGAATFKSVVVANTASDPVPVVSAAPVLRSGRLDIARAASVPAGVVVTDLVVWHMNAKCDVMLYQGDEQVMRLAPTTDAADAVGAELHLATGLPSTTERPVTLELGGGPFCPFQVSAFWSGYEG
jgi:hypothetical protein